MSSALPVPTVFDSEEHENEERDAKPTMADLTEPEDLWSGFRVAITAHSDVQSLIDSNGTWLVSWIGGHRAMAHLHELDLLELCQLLWVGGDLAPRRGPGSVEARRRRGGDAGEVFGEQSVSSFVLGWGDRLGYWTCVL
jgi:hypothetical protein